MTRNQRKVARWSLQTVTWGGLGAFVVLMATNGQAFLDALAALPTVLQRFSTVLPAGTTSFLLVTLISGFAWTWMRRLRHDFTADSVALAVALVLMLSLNWVSPLPEGTSPAASVLQAIMLGLLSGFVAPYLFKGFGLLWSSFVENGQ